ncbi:IS982 family transposase [Candidatus Poribacteria bacterium]|nr:IS982 family transposase [Candidatus Poribacteria bacterium]
MDLTIVAVYTICDDLLISLGHQDDPRAKMSDAEVMTTALIAARYFGGNQQTACAALKTLGYIPNMLGHSRFNRRLHQVSEHFQTLFQVLAEGFKAENSENIYSIDTFPVAVCDNIRISRSHLYQGPDWHGRIASKRRYFYGLKVHLMVTETGKIVEAFFTPGRCSDVLGLRCYAFDLPQGSVVYADKAYCNYGIEDALAASGISLKPIRKKNAKRQYPPHEVYLQHFHRKRVEVTNSLIEQLFPKSIHAVTAVGFELKVFLFIIATSIRQLFGEE